MNTKSKVKSPKPVLSKTKGDNPKTKTATKPASSDKQPAEGTVVKFEMDSFKKNFEESKPFFIRLRNLTDEKLYGVDLFNPDFAKQRKIEYSSFGSISYEHILKQMKMAGARNGTLYCVYIAALCDYQKFQKKQVVSPFTVIVTSKNGTVTSEIQTPTIDPYQTQDKVLTVKFHPILNQASTPMFPNGIPLDSSLQLKWDYLMPETEVTIQLYPSFPDKQKK